MQEYIFFNLYIALLLFVIFLLVLAKLFVFAYQLKAKRNLGYPVAMHREMGHHKLNLAKRSIHSTKKLIEGYLWLLSIYVGKIPSHGIRVILYKSVFGVSCGKNSTIYGRSEIISPWNLKIGNNSITGMSNIIDARNGIVIGNNVNISHQVHLWTMQHDPNSPSFQTSGGPIVIEDYVWISSRVTILPGITIGRGSVIASGSLVTKDVESYSIYAGIPAKKIGNRDSSISYNISCDGFIPFI